MARLHNFPMITVAQLGAIDYATGLRLQSKLVELRKAGRVGDVLLLLEHTPVITLGRNAKAANILASAELLARRGVAVSDCDRGGDVTFHGPGQVVGYPIFDLRGFPAEDGQHKTLGVIEYVRRLEEVLIRTCADFRIPAEPDAASRPGKVAAIGVHISRGVTSHGFALNVNTDLSFFDLIVPCGIATKPVTSMHRELGRELLLGDVAQSITRNFGTVFRSQILWVETLDALLKETLGVPARPPQQLRRLHKEDDTF